MKKLLLLAIIMLTLVTNSIAQKFVFYSRSLTKYQAVPPTFIKTNKVGDVNIKTVITITTTTVSIKNSSHNYSAKILTKTMGENNEIILGLPGDNFLFVEDRNKITFLNIRSGRTVLYRIYQSRTKL